MYTCTECERVFRSKGGLTTHRKTHKRSEDSEAAESILEVSDSNKRKINKLRDARNSTADALSRHNIDLKIKELEG